MSIEVVLTWLWLFACLLIVALVSELVVKWLVIEWRARVNKKGN